MKMYRTSWDYKPSNITTWGTTLYTSPQCPLRQPVLSEPRTTRWWCRCGQHQWCYRTWSRDMTHEYSQQLLVGGWALPLWKMMEFVSWDDYSIPNIWKLLEIHNPAMFQTTNQVFCWENDYSNRFTCRFDVFRRTLQTQKTETAEVCTPPFKVKHSLQSGRSKATRRHNITRYFGCEKWWAKYPAIYQHQIRMAHSHIVAPKIMGKIWLNHRCFPVTLIDGPKKLPFKGLYRWYNQSI